VVTEEESAALREWAGMGRTLVASYLLQTEALRVAGRIGVPAETMRSALGVVSLVLPVPSTFSEAGGLPPAWLRSLDAIHLATALELGSDLEGVVTYDRRMVEAAALASIPVLSPGG
jgi:predicted nucleic acid-binding protein